MAETRVESNIADRTITLTRVFDAPRELVWKAWTEPEHFARWAGCDGTTVPLSTISMDVRPGGAFSWTMVSDADGDQVTARGTYREVAPPERLVFSWHDPEPSVVTVTLTDLGGKTELRLRQVGFTSRTIEYGLANTREGLAEEIDRLAKYAADMASTSA